MKSTTSLVATQFRLQQWASQIQECNSRPDQVTVDEWCSQHGITRANYYYRLRKVRETCLDSVSRDIVPVPQEALMAVPDEQSLSGELTLSIGNVRIQVNQNTSVSLLKTVIKAVLDA
jgi:hypothetical protein